MNQIDIKLLERLVFVSAGLVGVIVVVLVAYIVIARRQEKARLRLYADEDIVIRPEHLVVGQVLSLVREVPGARLKVEVSGKKYNTLAEITDPQTRRQVVAAAMELIQFTGVLGAEVTAPAPKEKTQTWREDVRKGSQDELGQIHTEADAQSAPAQPQPSAEPPSPELEQQFLSLVAEMGQAAPAEKPTLMSSIQHRLTPKLPASDQPRTFIDDIEEIVQRRIKLIPALADRDVHVRSGPAGSVRFAFEGQEFENLDQVPNLTARQLIKDAIQEWDEIM